MSRETDTYRDNLERILEFTGRREVLTVQEVCAFCGFKDARTAKRRFKFIDGRISAATLARYFSGGSDTRIRR